MSAHHGNTPAAWTGVSLAMIGFAIGSAGFFLGPNWAVIWAGAGVVVLSIIVAYAMSLAGLGERPRKIAKG